MPPTTPGKMAPGLANSKKRAAQTYRLLIEKHPHCKYAGAAKSRLKLLQ